MSNTELVWQPHALPKISKKITNIEELVVYGIQLNDKDKRQIIAGFNSESYEMVTSYTLTKSITSLKNQLSKMGASFISEMLDRPDINEYSDIQQAISNFEAIKLAEELGVISGTSAFRLTQAMETVNHFNQIELEDDDENEMNEDEAKTIVRTCIQGILGYQRIEAAIDFKNFRSELENAPLTVENSYIKKLLQSPYFFHRTVIRILLSLVKKSKGAQLDNSIANSNLIIPLLWTHLQHPEKWQIGRAYTELFIDGQTIAATGLKKILLKVKGFDFVPEDLRSSSFNKVANEILTAHYGRDNFYNEPKPVSTLFNMGTVIPKPALSICITAILCVKLGNAYGVSRAAQGVSDQILQNISEDNWIYFFRECLQYNDRILLKLMTNETVYRWCNLFDAELLDKIVIDLQEKDLINLVKFTKSKDLSKLKSLATQMYKKIGYSE